MVKRKREADDEAPPPVQKPTVGQLTSGIGNKQVREEAYGKLKAAKKVSRPPNPSLSEMHAGIIRGRQGTSILTCLLTATEREEGAARST